MRDKIAWFFYSSFGVFIWLFFREKFNFPDLGWEEITYIFASGIVGAIMLFMLKA